MWHMGPCHIIGKFASRYVIFRFIKAKDPRGKIVKLSAWADLDDVFKPYKLVLASLPFRCLISRLSCA